MHSEECMKEHSLFSCFSIMHQLLCRKSPHTVEYLWLLWMPRAAVVSLLSVVKQSPLPLPE